MKTDKISKSKNKKGITLIALVVTIVILLILSAITVNLLLSDDGVIGKAIYAKEETRGGSVEEEKELWKLGNKYSKASQIKTLDKLVDELVDKKLLKENEKDKILGNKEKGIPKEGKITIGSRTIIFEELRLSDFAKVGDYVNYEPDIVEKGYLVEAKYSGLNRNYYLPQEKFKWQIFKIEEDKILLIADKRSEKLIEWLTSNDGFYGPDYKTEAIGYVNGVKLLNDSCNKLYSRKDIGQARSIVLEDVLDCLENQNLVDLNGFTSFEDNEFELDGSKFREKKNFSTSVNIYKRKLTGPKEINHVKEEYENIIFGTNNYYLATRFCNEDKTYHNFGFWHVSSSIGAKYSYTYLSNSGALCNTNTAYYRPIVELKSNINIVSDEKDNNAWKLDM